MKDLVVAGHTVIGLAGSYDEGSEQELATIGVGFRQFSLSRLAMNPLADLRTLFSLIRLMRIERPDVLVAYTIKAVIWGGVAARITGVPTFHALITGRGGPVSEKASFGFFSRLIMTLYKIGLSRANTVVFQNEEDRDFFIAEGIVRRDKTRRVNGSGVDLEHYSVDPPDESGPVFLMISRLLIAKGVREYVAAAKLVSKLYPTAKFRLLGSAEDGPGAISSDEVDLIVTQSPVEYLGYHDDVRDALSQSHVFVLPSFYGEGIPRSILEAMAASRPVITTDNVGCRDAVEHDVSGIIVAPRDVHSLTEGMIYMIDNRDRWPAMGDAGWQLARDRFDVNKVNAELRRIWGL